MNVFGSCIFTLMYLYMCFKVNSFAWDCLDKRFVGLKLYHLLKRIFQGKGQF